MGDTRFAAWLSELRSGLQVADRRHPRPEWFRLRMTFLEKKQLKKEAREARLTMSDYVRKKLGLPLSHKQSINVLYRQNAEAVPPPNPVDVEELARQLYAKEGIPMSSARREAEKRLHLEIPQ